MQKSWSAPLTAAAPLHTQKQPLPPGKFPLALAIPFLAVGAAVGIIGALWATTRQLTRPPPRMAHAWSAPRRAATAQLTAHPRDLEAELKLSRIFSTQAMFEGQESYAEASASGRAPYRQYMAAYLNRSQDASGAEALARHVATTAADSHLRARAWAHLAGLNRAMNRRDEQIRCLREAVREDPVALQVIVRPWMRYTMSEAAAGGPVNQAP